MGEPSHSFSARLHFAEQPQRFAQIPAADVEITRKHLLDHVARLEDRDVPVPVVRVDESHVVVAVRRRKAPRATAGLDRQQYANVVLALDSLEFCEDSLFHRRRSLPLGRDLLQKITGAAGSHTSRQAGRIALSRSQSAKKSLGDGHDLLERALARSN